MLKALLFDLDGTLANSDAVHFPTWIEVLRPYGIEVDREFYEERLGGRVNTDVVDDLLPDLSTEERHTLVEAEEQGSRRRTREIGPIPGLFDLLEEGRRRNLKIALVTNSVEEDADQILTPLGLEDAFDPVVYPSEVSDAKPSPAPYNEALKRMEIEPGEALAFEDSLTGVKAAVEAGIHTVGIIRSEDAGELKEAGVDLVIGDFLDRALYQFLDERS